MERETAMSDDVEDTGGTDMQTASRKLRDTSHETCVLELTYYLLCVLLVCWYVV